MTQREFIAEKVAEAIRAIGPFVIEAPGLEGCYVQGGPTGPQSLYLEAADLDLQQTGTLSDEQVSALSGLRFVRGEQNFTQTISVSNAEVAPAVAADLLTQVFSIYGISESHPLRSGSELSCSWLETRDVLGTPYPPYIQTEDEKLRWNWCALVAAGIAADQEPEDPAARSAFIIPAIRTYYNEPTITCGEDERLAFEASLAEARALGIVPPESDFY